MIAPSGLYQPTCPYLEEQRRARSSNSLRTLNAGECLSLIAMIVHSGQRQRFFQEQPGV